MSEVQKLQPHTQISSLPTPPIHGPKDNRYKKKQSISYMDKEGSKKLLWHQYFSTLTFAIARKSTALTEIKNKPLFVLLLNFWTFKHI